MSAYTRNPHRQPIGGPLTSAAERADEFLRLACLTYGADSVERRHRARALLDAHPGLSATSIYTAAALGNLAATRRFLAADPGLASRDGGPFEWEPLLYLAYSRVDGDDPIGVAQLLLEHGADPEAGYLWEGLPSPFTALAGAFGRGEGDQPPHQHRFNLARLLLNAGANANDSQALYNCGLHRDEGDDYLRLLLAGGLGRGSGGIWHQRLGDAHPSPAQLLQDELIKAAERGRIERARLLLPAGVIVDGIGTGHPIFEGRNAWELATINGHAEFAKLLAAHGAMTSGDPVLGFLGACMRADRPAIDRLIGADPSIRDAAIDYRPHHIVTAAENGLTDAVRLMVELGFDVDVLHRATPLHQAAFHGHVGTVEALLELGADPEIADPAYRATPLGWAEHAGQSATAELLRTARHRPSAS
ncbi:hypothetical protein F4553_003976 [Allocatelliglobosispora scoriae]|uniref:Ankyrin repeat domain-containing protein n=1 Tax=Allocatelliglobosispora scoriae TaxID=643052 RepID=A0A841BND4_9ACTN|nr:ankyrin repeat domain-containing protein [Allocatelliglobosispora scoriae]MBB5870597.1 hypothetical protein [Allocatelliglobosispora scoriae]